MPKIIMNSANASALAVESNRLYYDDLYGGHGQLGFIIHALLSYDQQSKTNFNMAIVGPILRQWCAEGRSVKVMDYGCGWGTFLMRLPRQHVDAYGWDISEKAMGSVSAMMRLFGRVFRRAEVDEIGLVLPAGYDLIVCSHVLEHVPCDDILLASMVKALRPGGYLLVNVPINEEFSDPKHVRAYNEEILFAKFIAAGLSVNVVSRKEKWAGFFLRITHMGAGAGLLPVRIMLKMLKVLLAVAPLRLIEWLANHLFKDEQPQQLIMLGVRMHDGAGSNLL